MPERSIFDPAHVSARWLDADRSDVILLELKYVGDDRTHTIRLTPEAAGAIAAGIHKLFVDLAAEIGEPHHEFPGGTVDIDGDRTTIELKGGG